MSVIQEPFCFLEVGKEGSGADAAQSAKRGVGVSSERLNAMDMAASSGKFNGTEMNSIGLVAFKKQAVLSAPFFGENNGSFLYERLIHLYP
jgi:hypothetical protein